MREAVEVLSVTKCLVMPLSRLTGRVDQGLVKGKMCVVVGVGENPSIDVYTCL